MEGAFAIDVFGASAAVAGFAGWDEVVEVVGATCVPCDDVIYFGGWGASAPYADWVVGEDDFAVALELGGCASRHVWPLSWLSRGLRPWVPLRPAVSRFFAVNERNGASPRISGVLTLGCRSTC